MSETEQTPPDRPDVTGPLPGYRLYAQLARTGMSEVFRAEEVKSGRPVALKVIGPELMRLPGFAERFERESHVAASIRHANIVDVYAAGKADGGRLGYLAMRFVEGSNLRQMIEDGGRLGLGETVAIARQVAAALDAAHARRVVHRDVKPANILVEEGTGRVYLCDFGIAKDIELSSITTTGATIGSLLYLSPEQRANSRAVDHRTDVYSLGCVLYDCLAGLPSAPTRDRRIGPIPLLGSPVDRVLRKAMAENPDDRHGTCGELAEDLAAAAKRTPHLFTALAVTVIGVTAALVAAVAFAVVDSAPDSAALARVDPSFPTADERALLDLVAGTGCVRASTVDLDAFPAAVAGLTCIPLGSGAREVSYYRFASLAELRASFTGQVNGAKAPSGVACATGAAPGFLGTARHDWLGVDLGQLLCQPGPDGTLSMAWSMEPLLIAGRVIGSERGPLQGWWSQWHLAPLSRIVDAVNAQSAPPFPNEAERALLNHIPPASRLNCVRPSPGQVWANVGAATVTAVACGRTSGAALVVYYQFPSVEAMRSVFNALADSEKDCTKEFNSSRPYSRGNGSSGRLRCGADEGTRGRYLEWTDDRLAIAVYAARGSEPFAMIDWWTHDAGPV